MLKKSNIAIKTIAIVGFILLLCACSNDANMAKDQAETKDNKDNSTEIRKVSTVMGEIEVPDRPKRVVVDWYLGQVMALGLIPVGAPSTLTDYGKFLEPLVSDEMEDIGTEGTVSMEKVLELEPDLIITWDQEAYENYAKIAPTIIFDGGSYNSIHEEINAMAEILNRKDEAKKWLTEFDQRVDAAKAKIKDVIPEGATFTIADYSMDKNIMIIGDRGERGSTAAYKLLGLTPSPKVKSDIIDKNQDRVDTSWETVGDYMGDYIISMKSEESDKVDLPKVWTNLDAVKNNHVYEFDIKKFFNADPLSALYQAEEIADKLVEGSK
ncbi:ABC transporter substrate-binding protein [Sporosarcina sp. ANT_H38]|uniref:ABC transporter substrate-binding protein n=1 Tax=Sporosarcina sp. ANT_H38 TaxID=2597358 RepID=UPI00165EAECB|nr:ABC transporter substrate-binding protein [Sporosarcina sp. ANT_H38]